ncbi:MAG: TetR/AcrR family transcriptional regulator [Myxococcota bacterium]|nr:TetR/AcrR family transcriptional regulator [Myxococcota bacterium]
MPRTADERRWGGEDFGERHREVLREALRLIAERGYAGASLRELARRVGIQQPSLYHYFRSKEEMVDQIILTFGVGGMYSVPPGLALPDRIEELPRTLATIVHELYGRTDWPVFVRFVFNLSMEQPIYAERLRAMFVDTFEHVLQEMLRHYVEQDQIDAREAQFLSRMVINAIGLSYLEQKVVFPSAGPHADLREYADFVVRVAETAIASRAPDGTIARGTIAPATPRPRAGRSTRARGPRAAR